VEYFLVKEAVKNVVPLSGVFKGFENKRIHGAIRFARVWAIPKDAQKPRDGRRRDFCILEGFNLIPNMQ